MGFLDNIGQRGAGPRPQPAPPTIAPSVPRDDAVSVVQKPQTSKPAQSNRYDRIVARTAVLFVIAVVSIGAWYGLHTSSTAVSPDGEAVADTPSQGRTSADATPGVKRSEIRPRAVVRASRDTNAKSNAGIRSEEAPADDGSASSVPAHRVATIREAGAPPFETVSDSVAAAFVAGLPGDEYVYSSEADGVVAPRLLSLGFVQRLVNGVGQRTSTIELLVSKSGTVERARIYSRPRNWEDALLLSRAKTFQFVPAKRDGFPVRYRYVMEVDTSP
jgi:hypothetical protein